MEVKEKFQPNSAQAEAINATEGPVMLLAGPGTGKTFTLIKRIERMLDMGINPSSILCLTFSEAAANEMKTRLIGKIGTLASCVNISTYHSFCMDIIRQNPDDFEMTENVRMADEVTKQTIIKETIDEINEIDFLKDKWGNKYFYVSKILSSIETIKRERTSKEEYFNYIESNPEWQIKLNDLILELKDREKNNKPTKTCIGKIETLEKKIGKAKEFYSIYEIYKQKLNENSLIDFSDMINFVLEKMETDTDFLENISKEYKYILVDEYQDTSKVQNDLIFNLLRGAKHNNIFVVGDDDQIIYSFQGARSKNLGDFLERFPKTKIICLIENRRSTQTILDFAEKLIDFDRFRLAKSSGLEINKKLIAKNESVISKEEKIKFNIYTETIQENNNIVKQIQDLIKNEIKPSEIAILSRKNDTLENFARLLKQKNIPYILQRQKNAFEVSSFIQLYFYLKLLVNSYLEQDKLFGLLSGEPFKIEDKTIAEILIASRQKNLQWIEIIKDIKTSSLLNKFYETFIELKDKKSSTPLIPYLYEIISKTGLLEYYSNKEEERFENIQAIQRLIDEAHSFMLLHKGARLNDFVSHLDTYFKQDIKIEMTKPIFKTEAIQLLTYHGSKGREFEHVFMPNLTAKAFEKFSGGNQEIVLPIKKSVFCEEPDLNKEAELLRLLFVGITRAKYGLHLSYSNLNEGNPQIASEYISRVFPDADSLVEQNFYEMTEEEKTLETIKNLQVCFNAGEYKNEIRKRTENLVLSQTSLNKYINCPLEYFYSDILKVPVFVEDKDILEYGSSIHRAIDYMTKEAIKDSKWGNIQKMKINFIQNMNECEFTSFDKKKELLDRGLSSIEKNFPKLIESSPLNIISTEYRMEKDYKGALLKGFADRISKDNEGNINIFDFKTGSYKKVDDNENYYNQLRFYKFLYENINPDKKVGKTALIFFEEGCRESYPKENCTDNNEIEEKIQKAISGIKSLNFEPNKKSDNCKYCPYKLICKLQIKDIS